MNVHCLYIYEGGSKLNEVVSYMLHLEHAEDVIFRIFLKYRIEPKI